MAKAKPQEEQRTPPIEVHAYALSRKGEGWVIVEFTIVNDKVVSATDLTAPDMLHITHAKLLQKIKGI